MKIRSVLGLALLLGSSSLVFGQANLAGKWTGTMAGRGGDQPVTLELTVAGAAITGKLTQGAGMAVDITDAKWADSKLTFSAAGGGGGGRGGGAGAPGGGAPGGGAPAGGPPAAGGPGGGGGGGGRGGGGRVQNYSGVLNAAGTEMTVTREAPAAPAGGAPGGGAPGGAAPAGGAPAGGGAGGGRGGGGGGPVTFTLKKG